MGSRCWGDLQGDCSIFCDVRGDTGIAKQQNCCEQRFFSTFSREEGRRDKNFPSFRQAGGGNSG